MCQEWRPSGLGVNGRSKSPEEDVGGRGDGIGGAGGVGGEVG